MTPLSQDSAEVIAIEALSWLAGTDDLFTIFMGSTGTSAVDVRTRAQDPEFLASVLDFLLMDDAWISAFCAAENYDPDFPMRARAALPGGAQVSWT
ncbi:MAG: DUF3572 family protein [Boseongicola sp.]|nr:MAG: DUF3572 family protein [Boseongicola sp.]